MSDERLYPQGKHAVDARDALTATDLAFKIPGVKRVGGQDVPKNITLQNILENLFDVKLKTTEITASAAIPATATFVQINSATPSTAIALTVAAPAAGRLLVISQIDSGTAGNTVTLTSGTFDGTNNEATFNAKYETLVLLGIDTSRFVIVENIGSVALATG